MTGESDREERVVTVPVDRMRASVEGSERAATTRRRRIEAGRIPRFPGRVTVLCRSTPRLRRSGAPWDMAGVWTDRITGAARVRLRTGFCPRRGGATRGGTQDTEARCPTQRCW